MIDETAQSRVRATPLVAWITILSVAIAVGVLAFGRQFLTFRTETDFVSMFLRQARMIFDGQSPQFNYHPPLYPFALAAVKQIGGGWFATGLLVSWFSCVLALVAQYRFFASIIHRKAALGSVLALATSTVFVTYSAMATSDLVFFALWSVALWLTAAASITPARWRWAAAGLAVGLAMLTRTNGVTLLCLAVLPWIPEPGGNWRSGWRNFAAWTLGLAAPLTVWTVLALSSGSNLVPGKNYANLAMTYFGSGNRISWESRIAVEQQFEGLLDVITHDPVRMAKQYLRDLLYLPARLSESAAVALPVAILALTGALFAIRRLLDRRVLVFVAATALQVGMINLKAFEGRFYLFLLPWFGAVAGVGISELLARFRPAVRRAAGVALVLGLLLFASLVTYPRARSAVHENDDELSWIVATVRESLPQDAMIVARKRHLEVYADVTIRMFPDVSTLDALREALAEHEGETLFVYYGSVERGARPELSDLSDPRRAPDWLEPVAVSPAPRAWTLYRATLPGPDRRPATE